VKTPVCGDVQREPWIGLDALWWEEEQAYLVYFVSTLPSGAASAANVATVSENAGSPG